jgi:FkbM family methyltransferase
MSEIISSIKEDDQSLKSFDINLLIITFDELKVSIFLFGQTLLKVIQLIETQSNDYKFEFIVFEEEVLPNLTLLLNKLNNKGFEIVSLNSFSSFFKLKIKKNSTEFLISAVKKSRKNWRYNSNQRFPVGLFKNASQVEFFGENFFVPSPPELMLDIIYSRWRTSSTELDIANTNRNSESIPIGLKFFINFRQTFVFLKAYLPVLKSGLISKSRPSNREYLFSNIMLRKALSPNCYFIEIGSSNGLEMFNAIKFTKGLINGYVIEPSIENLELVKQKIKKIAKRFDTNIVFKNQLISGLDADIDYFYSQKNSNLSSIFPSELNTERRIIKSSTLQVFMSENNLPLSEHVVIKMDVEGAEVEILESSLEIFQKMKNVSLLMEVHPTLYKNNRMEEILKLMISTGFKITLCESAGIHNPIFFKDDNFMPYMSYNTRGLFKDFDEDKVITACSKKIFEVIKYKPFFMSKVVRSILIEKIQKDDL